MPRHANDGGSVSSRLLQYTGACPPPYTTTHILKPIGMVYKQATTFCKLHLSKGWWNRGQPSQRCVTHDGVTSQHRDTYTEPQGGVNVRVKAKACHLSVTLYLITAVSTLSALTCRKSFHAPLWVSDKPDTRLTRPHNQSTRKNGDRVSRGFPFPCPSK